MPKKGPGDAPRTISARELRTLIASGGRPLLLDVRDPSELRGPNGRVPGSTNIRLAGLRRGISGLFKQRDREMITICNTGAPEGRAAAAARLLSEAGLPRVRRLAGGMIAWNRITLQRRRS